MPRADEQQNRFGFGLAEFHDVRFHVRVGHVDRDWLRPASADLASCFWAPFQSLFAVVVILVGDGDALETQ
jgi:hypothetical protein